MIISHIDMMRDGGTIVFVVGDGPIAGSYRLQTPLMGLPRPLFKDDHRLEFASREESEIRQALERWLGDQLTPVLSDRLAELNRLPIWQNLPKRLADLVPLHRIQQVIICLKERASQE